MDKRQAQDYIQQVLNSKFDQEQFELFIRNLLNEFEPKNNNYSGNLIPEAFREHIAHYKRIGKYTDPEGEALDILIVQTRSVSKLERTRTALRNFVVRHLKNFDKYYALVAFYSKEDDGDDWRLSLVKIDIEKEKTAQGKIKAREELVPARRFSYLVGVNEHAYTAQKQLLPLLVNDHSNPLVVKEKDGDGSIEGAFSIEKVTDEFYEQYKELYLKLTENTKLTKALEREGLEPVRFVKKLLGQIVFLYFLQKKGWLGVPKDEKMGKGSKRFLQDRYEAMYENGQNYFNDFLRYLFYEALAHEHHDDGIRYYFKQLGCKIPFLNGGLFEADYEWEKADITIPNDLFRNKEKNKAGDKGTGILDVFDRYNFTIKEDEPLEKEVAVDPEMLGKVFENLLEVKDRKSKGAFYTPREIVHYMCQESLIHYLDNAVNEYTESYLPIDSDQVSLFGGSTDKKGNLKIELENKGDIRVPKEDIGQLIRNGHLVLEHDTIVAGKGKETKRYSYKLPESVRTHAKDLDDALADIKICDPAIGSGAFPVGMLNEIVTARLVLIPYLNQSPSSKKSNHSLSFNQTNHSYRLKRHAIKESIYGVDIDASATDIARLRLWLSMIVDEEDYDRIEALPNLDYKIVCGNSLIGMPENAMRDLAVEEDLEKLKKIFFHETDESKKKKLRQQINTKIRQLLDSAEQFAGYKIDFDFKLYFSEVWHQKNGFDVVIGNPPYIQLQKALDEKSKFADLYKNLPYKTFERTGDIYALFYEKGIEILNKNGCLIYITSNKWMRAHYGKSLRKFFSTKNPLLLIDMGPGVFDTATVDTNILLVENRPNQHALKALTLRSKEKISQLAGKDFVTLKKLNEESWIILNPQEQKIKERIEQIGTPLKDWDISIYRGVLTGFNEAFIIDGKTKDELIRKDPKSAEIIKPILRGRDIKRYKAEFADLWLIATFPALNLNINDYPAVKEYLEQFLPKIKQTGETFINSDGKKEKTRKKTGNKWFETQDQISYYQEFEKEKIGWKAVGRNLTFSVIEKGAYITAPAAFLTSDYNKYIVSILQSKLILYRVLQDSDKTGAGDVMLNIQSLIRLPIPRIPKSDQKSFETLVDYIITLKEAGRETESSFFEAVIDALVFELYFGPEMEQTGKEIFRQLGALKPIKAGMSEEGKLALIRSEFERLYDPNHPVRNNLETLDSIEEVRIIREALKS